MAEPVPIQGDVIRLGQFLKLANLVDSGSVAKEVIAGGEVLVNGLVETRRGRQLSIGDVVQLGGQFASPVDATDYDDDLPW
ncbi:MAG: RNA-binding S4 domain-containing protein [Nocardioides sp.]|uniref:RNA-binding S4 domain-containing protein n=1 Tax=Nocardioides sp. TaxID=35761 RepID=UPI0039E37D68